MQIDQKVPQTFGNHIHKAQCGRPRVVLSYQFSSLQFSLLISQHASNVYISLIPDGASPVQFLSFSSSLLVPTYAATEISGKP